MKLLSRISAFIMANLVKLLAAALAITLLYAGVQTWRLNSTKAKLERSETAALLFVERVKATSQKIIANHRARVARIEQAQNQITQEVSRDYQDRIADLNRRVAALRVRPSGTNSGGAVRAAGGSSIPDTSARVDGPAGQAGLPTEDAIIATEQAIRLDELQNWVRRQMSVER